MQITHFFLTHTHTHTHTQYEPPFLMGGSNLPKIAKRGGMPLRRNKGVGYPKGVGLILRGGMNDLWVYFLTFFLKNVKCKSP